MAHLNKVINILHVEDNFGDVNLVKIYLHNAKLKHRIFIANTLKEAYTFLDQERIDIVLLDLSLPDSTGFRTLSSFLDIQPDFPVIVMTGNNDEIVGNQAVKAGAQDFLVKGEFDEKLLSRVIRYSIQRYTTEKKLKSTAQELAVNQSRFVEAQQMANFGNWEVDIVTNEMKWTDEVFRIFGFKPNAIMPSLSDYINYVHFEDRSKIENFFDKASKDGKRHKVEHKIIIDGRKIRHLRTYAKAHYDDITQKIILLGGVQDITERKLNEQYILEKNISKRSDKLREAMLEDLTFQVRTPLASLVNLTYLLQDQENNPEQSELISQIRASIDDLAFSVNNMQNFSLLLSGSVNVNKQTFKIKQLLDSLEKIFHLAAEKKNITLDFNTDPDLPQLLRGDPKRINQILFNLIENAIKFTKHDGEVSINSRLDKIIGKTAIVTFVVKDTGIGIEPQKIKSLYETELQEDNDETQKLGLLIVNKLIESMEGKLNISSKLSSGSTFEVSLSFDIEEMEVSFQDDKPQSKLHILLVEDHFLNQIAAKKILTSWSDKVSVDIAENGEEGIEKFKKEEYDLILMDIQMPIMNGLEATTAIREFDETTPIVALTANASTAEAEKCMTLGFTGYLAKPYQPMDLYSKIMEVLNKTKRASS